MSTTVSLYSTANSLKHLVRDVARDVKENGGTSNNLTSVKEEDEQEVKTQVTKRITVLKFTQFVCKCLLFSL